MILFVKDKKGLKINKEYNVYNHDDIEAIIKDVFENSYESILVNVTSNINYSILLGLDIDIYIIKKPKTNNQYLVLYNKYINDSKLEVIECCSAMPIETFDLDCAPLIERRTLKPSRLKSVPFEIKLDESFSERLNRFLIEKDVDNADCWKAANISRKTFSKILCEKNYHPTKTTVLAIAISLKLTIKETNELLEPAGYVLTKSDKIDYIVMYFIENKIYDILTVNEALFDCDLKVLGAK